MKFTSLIISRGSGSFGGITVSHNKGGQYMRARTVPTDPGSVFQTAVRTIMASLVNLWNDTLTQAQRDDWAVYASNTPLIDQFGDPRTVTGLNMYTRVNVPRLQAALTRVDDGPVEFNTGDFTNVSAIFSAAGGLSLTFANADTWANEDGSSMLVYVGPPQNENIQFFKGPYRFADTIDGNSTTAPTSPAVISPTPFSFTEGQKVFGRVTVARADGRLSTTQRFGSLAIA